VKKPSRLIAGAFGVQLAKDERLQEGKLPYTERPVYIDVGSLTADPSKYGYEVYARDVPCPLSDVEAGSIVVCEYDGHPAKWLNGTIYIRKVHLGE
jgi:hypothetical protein